MQQVICEVGDFGYWLDVLVGIISSNTVLKMSDHSTQKLFTLSVEKIDVGTCRHCRVVQAVSKSASL